MNISINSTFSYIKFNLNYGSALQCYALQKYLKARGHNVSHIRDYRANPKYILMRLKNVKYTNAFYQKAKAQVMLQQFIRKHMSFSQRAYFSYRSMVKHCPEAECHIAGSDQIWHNANHFRYLSYVPEDKLKISYAASFGRAEISDEMIGKIAPYLSRFDGISVREASGVAIVNRMGYVAEHVLDPTLLLDSENYPYDETEEHDYCYCYFLNLTKKSDVAFDQIRHFCEKQGKKLYITAPINYPLFLQDDLRFPSVEKWLGLYKNADYIFTNTYHGLLFCIIYKKQFLLFPQQGPSQAENERFYSLLSTLELTDRIISSENVDDISKVMENPIDYKQVYSIIEEQRRITEKYFSRFGL